MKKWVPVCDLCGSRDPRKAYRLNPRNLHQEFVLACSKCCKTHGYRHVNYERPYAEMAARTIMRGAA